MFFFGESSKLRDSLFDSFKQMNKMHLRSRCDELFSKYALFGFYWRQQTANIMVGHCLLHYHVHSIKFLWLTLVDAPINANIFQPFYQTEISLEFPEACMQNILSQWICFVD